MQNMNKKAKRSLSWLLVMTMILSLCAMPAGAALADTPDLEIGSLAELQAFAAAVDNGETYEGKTVVLTADIDASGTTWNPIGEKADNKSFRGTFDGSGHTVTLSIKSASGYNGLFCYNFGTIKNVKIAGSVETTAKNAMYNGAVCAMNKSGALVDSCINEAVCTYAGGYSAGVVGQNAGTVSNCINRGSVSVGGTMGGAITCAGTVTNCLNIGSLSGKAYNISFAGNVSYSYYLDTSSSPSATRFYGVSKTEAELKDPAFAATLGEAFAADPNGGFPVLAWELEGGAEQPHVHDFRSDEVVSPTCTEKGYTVYKCSCGETERRDEKPALGHKLELGLVEPNGNGTHTGTCSRCDEEVTEDCTYAEGYCTVCEDEHAHGDNIQYTTVSDYVHSVTCSVCGYDTSKNGPHEKHDFKYTAKNDGTHTKSCGKNCGFSKVEDCTYENGKCKLCKAEEASAPVVIPVCNVRVTLGFANASFKVPSGTELKITWKFVNDENGVPKGWQMLVNGMEPVEGGYSYAVPENEAGITGTIPSGMVLFTTGKPDNLSFTPADADCADGVTKELKNTPLTREQLLFELKFVDIATKEVIGTYGDGYTASGTYGAFTISATRYPVIGNYVTRHYNGYRIYMGTYGNTDRQEKTVHVGADGVIEKSVTMFVEINHSTQSDKHVQSVKFVDGDKTVLKTDVPLKNAYVNSYTPIELDMTKAAEALRELGYELDMTKKYTVKCNDYTHDPAVTVIEVTKIAAPECDHELPIEFAKDNGDGTHTAYCVKCEREIIAAHEYDEDGFCKVCYAEHEHSVFTYAKLNENYHNKICKDCERTVSEAHAWNDGVTDGNKVTYTCTLCGETKVESTSPFTYTVNEGKATITGLRDKTVTVAEIPKTIDGYTVTAIADNAFAFEKEITKVVIPDTVTTIGANAFLNCWGLSEVKLGNAVASIGDDAFGFAKALKTIDIPDSVKTIGAEAFARGALTEIEIGKNVTVIGDGAFLDCDNLKAINVAVDNAFYSSKDGVLFDKSGETLIQYPDAKEGATYNVPDGVETIGVKAFYRNEILEKVVLSNSVSSIKEAAFSYSQIRNISLGNGLESIAEAAFEWCAKLENVTFPSTLKTIGKAAFYQCTSITEVVIPDSVTTIGKSAFQRDTGIKTVILGTGVKTIGAVAFGNNANLETFKVFSKEDITWNGYAVFDIALDGLTVYGYCDSGLKDYCKTATTNFEAMHSYKDGVCTVCGEKDPNYKPPAPPVHTHTVVIDQAVAATCTKSGLTEGKHCSVCKAIIVAQQEIKALGHTPEEVAAVAATCTETGLTAGSKCSVCGEVLTAQEVVPALGHKFVNGVCTVCGEKDPTYVPPVVNPFKDVEKTSPYFDAIIWAADKGVTKGVTPDTFGVNDGCTRAQIVTFLYRAAGSPEVKADTVNPFTDVSKDSVYYNAILWAVEKGITKGTTETTFDPNAVCTRGQAVTFLFRASGAEKVATGTDFTDVAATSYCADAVAWAVANKVANGFGDGTFRPEATCTRGQAVTFIYRALAK